MLLIIPCLVLAAGAMPSADPVQEQRHLSTLEGTTCAFADASGDEGDQHASDEEALLQVSRLHGQQPVTPVLGIFTDHLVSGMLGTGADASAITVSRLPVALGDGMASDPLQLPTGLLVLLFVFITAVYVGRKAKPAGMAEIWHVAFPISMSNMFEYLPNFAAVFVLGTIIHSRTEQAATALGRAVADGCFIFSWGLTSALHTLAPQAEGAGKRNRQALYLQQGLLVVSMASVVLSAVMFWSGGLLRLMGQARGVTIAAVPYILLCIPRLFCESYTTVLQRVGQAMGLARPFAWLSFLGVGAGLVFLYVFVMVADMGYLGIACAISALKLFNVFTHFIYLWLAGQSQLFKLYDPWKDIVKWSGMHRYLELAVPGTMHICFEWWGFVGLTMFTGLLQDPELNLAACVVVMTVKDILYMAWQGVAGAASIAVGKAVGAQSREDVDDAVRASTAVALTASVLAAVPLWFGGHWVAALLTSNAEVQSKVAGVFRVLAVFVVPDCLNVTFAGMLRGMGLQRQAALHQFLGFWVIGIPLTAFVASQHGSNPFGLELIWGAFVIAVAVSAPLNKACILRTNWDDIFAAAKTRLTTPEPSDDEGGK